MKTNELLNRVEELAHSAESWADFSNALFNPSDGLLIRAFPTRAARAAFAKTKDFQRIQDMLDESIVKHGLVEGATPKKSGKFVVRMPRSLHFALEQEAQTEGVSLNQLVLTKLAVQLKDATDRRKRA